VHSSSTSYSTGSMRRWTRMRGTARSDATLGSPTARAVDQDRVRDLRRQGQGGGARGPRDEVVLRARRRSSPARVVSTPKRSRTSPEALSSTHTSLVRSPRSNPIVRVGATVSVCFVITGPPSNPTSRARLVSPRGLPSGGGPDFSSNLSSRTPRVRVPSLPPPSRCHSWPGRATSGPGWRTARTSVPSRARASECRELEGRAR
jgi:hypothetical protein